MRLYLVRHGKAVIGAEQEDRPLSPRGRSDITAMANHLARQGVSIESCYHSTLSRARQSAEVLRAIVSPSCPLKELPGIEPWGDIKAFTDLAARWDEDVMVCGHEPFMGMVAARLLCGDAHAARLEVKTGTVMAFERRLAGSDRKPLWALRWMLTPRMVRGPKTDSGETWRQ